MGDFNSRTATKDDFIKVDNYLTDKFGYDYSENENNLIMTHFLQNQIFKERKNRDTIVNSYGNMMLDFCKNANLFILNGRFGKIEQNMSFTCQNRSTVDYVLCTSYSFSMLKDLTVLDFNNMFSDAHCPISLTLQMNPEHPEDKSKDKYNITQNNIIINQWNHKKIIRFFGKF